MVSQKYKNLEAGAAMVEVAIAMLSFMLTILFGISAILTTVKIAQIERSILKITRNLGLGAYTTAGYKLVAVQVLNAIRNDSGMNSIRDIDITFCQEETDCSVDDLPNLIAVTTDSTKELSPNADFIMKVKYPIPGFFKFSNFTLKAVALGRYEPDISGAIINTGN